MNSRVAWAVLAAVCGIFIWGLVRLYDLRLTSGDMYPVYSSYRSDPLGAKVLFESLRELPGYTVDRNFRGMDELRPRRETLLWLGEDPYLLALRPEDDLKQFESLAARGIRLVIGLLPVRRVTEPTQLKFTESALEKRWGITFTYAKRLEAQNEEIEGALPKQTALIMKSGGQPAAFIEKPFGKGAVVLVDTAYPFSNEALATDRNTDLLLKALGPNHTVMFDEHHLGLTEQASIAMLARKYRLMGLALGLLILAVLFIWRNSSPLLPARRRPAGGEARLASNRDSASALQHLLRRNIAEPDLIPTCLAEWKKTAAAASRYSPDKRSALNQLARPQSKRNPVEIYREMQSILSNERRTTNEQRRTL